jgi:hypothetical protein
MRPRWLSSASAGAAAPPAISPRQFRPGTLYADNVYQRHDWLLRDNYVAGANNLNVSTTTWGQTLVHTTIAESPNVPTLIETDLANHVVR